jgi:hypothetical protein
MRDNQVYPGIGAEDRYRRDDEVYCNDNAPSKEAREE